MTKTLGSALKRAEDRPSGFDYLRLSLAVSIIAWHTITVCYGPQAEAPLWTQWFRPLPFFIIPAFFALSGFLVAGSLERNSIGAFVVLRVIRIAPALAVEVLVSALIIGPLVTRFDLSAYFQDHLFQRYFLNLFGYIQYFLPGVFTDQPAPWVNLQLWTVPFELECYVAVTILAALGVTRRPSVLLLVAVAAAFVLTVNAVFRSPPTMEGAIPGRGLVVAFLVGVALYGMREVVPFSRAAFLASLIAYIGLCLFPQTLFLSVIPAAYVTVYVGLLNPPRVLLVKGADYSYGIFLYGYPIQQTVSFFLPELRLPLFNFMMTLPVVCLLAWMSWVFVESKVLSQRKGIIRFIEQSAGLWRTAA